MCVSPAHLIHPQRTLLISRCGLQEETLAKLTESEAQAGEASKKADSEKAERVEQTYKAEIDNLRTQLCVSPLLSCRCHSSLTIFRLQMTGKRRRTSLAKRNRSSNGRPACLKT